MLIGRVDRVPGVCYVATDVVELAWIPLWPRATWLVEEGSETHGRYYRSRLAALFDDTIESTVAVRAGTEVHAQQWRGKRLPFSGRSFGRGLATRLAAIVGAALVLAMIASAGFHDGHDLIAPFAIFAGLVVTATIARSIGRLRAANTLRAAALALVAGAFVSLPWWLLPLGGVLIAAAIVLHDAPLADPARALELGALVGAKPATIREAIAASGKRAAVPRAKTVTAAKIAKPAAPPPTAAPLPPPKPLPPPTDLADGPRFLT